MRFIYLSRTEETSNFGTRNDTIKFFEDFLTGNRRSFKIKKDGTRSKIDKRKFEEGEDIIFVRIADIATATVEVIAYCRSRTKLLDSVGDPDYPMYFEPDVGTIKIFEDGIDLTFFDKFVSDNQIKGVTRTDYFTSFIIPGKTLGRTSWRYFEEDDSEHIMEWFKKLVFEKYSHFSKAH